MIFPTGWFYLSCASHNCEVTEANLVKSEACPEFLRDYYRSYCSITKVQKGPSQLCQACVVFRYKMLPPPHAVSIIGTLWDDIWLSLAMLWAAH